MRTVMIGLDSFDPGILEDLLELGKLPNLSRYVDRGTYSSFSVSDPPQSEVSWTSIASGLNPGGHGMFDFVHRNPQNYQLYVSLLPTKHGIGGTRFARPSSATTIFDKVAEDGYPATALWWPALFPAKPQSPVRTIPGLGTPDILGRLGVGVSYTTAAAVADMGNKIPVESLAITSKGRYRGNFSGPASSKQGQPVLVPFELEMLGAETARISFAKESLVLKLGEWSRIIELDFKMGLLFSVRAITRLVLTHTQPEIKLYALPLQIHPLKDPWYATPPKFVKQTWQEAGPFLTLGWPQDTTALEEGRINDDQFLQLCASIEDERERALFYHLERFQEGLLACVFDTLDRVQHMFLKQRPDVIAGWYIKLDQLVGRVEQRLKELGAWESTRLVILSDHGFEQFDQKVHLNRWLMDHGYLYAHKNESEGAFDQIDWTRTRAYGIGLNSIYLNLQGREGQGIVTPAEKSGLVDELAQHLLRWETPAGEHVIRQAMSQEQAFDGPLAEYGPDLLVGYAPGFRASQQTGLGNWMERSVEPNVDHWGADHCMYAAAVPGVIFTNHNYLKNFSRPSYRDIPALAIDAQLDHSKVLPPPSSGGQEDEATVQERLRSLGYL